ncbi:hypothetical protein AURDEDRAFT_123919 [Auricularia subglabra TFB-10046 SS5]|nr:hypothetical protein AURDEDRAFT_123919 [Auricularia subglabra TFB-10046 SS5]
MSEILIEDDNEAHVSYYPDGAWRFRTKTLSDDDYHGASYHLTSTPGAYATFTFNGSYVAYYSDLNFDHGAFTVSLDGRIVLSGSSQSATLLKQRVLFSSAVAPGRHVLTITNAQDANITGVDYFIYHSDYPTSYHSDHPTSYHFDHSTSYHSAHPTAVASSTAGHAGVSTTNGLTAALAADTSRTATGKEKLGLISGIASACGAIALVVSLAAFTLVAATLGACAVPQCIHPKTLASEEAGAVTELAQAFGASLPDLDKVEEVLVEDDDASHVSYYPPGAWENPTAPAGLEGAYHAGSYHRTSTLGAYVNLKFNGTFVAYYSDLNNDHGKFNVSIDGRTVFAGNSQSESWLTQRLLFATPLPPGRHILAVTNVQNKTVGVDYFMYVRMREGTGRLNRSYARFQPDPVVRADNSTDPTHISANANASGTGRRIIVGLASACGVFLLLAILAGLSLVRARRRRRIHRDEPPPPYEDTRHLRPSSSPPCPAWTVDWHPGD